MGSSSQQATVPNIASQDIASRALTAAHRVHEAKQLYRKAEAVWVYAQRSGDYELQSEAAEIRLFAQRRAGELMAEMAIHSGSRGQGRPRRDEATAGRSNGGIYAVTLEEVGVTKNRPSKWQQVATWISALPSKGRVWASLYRALPTRTLSKHP